MKHDLDVLSWRLTSNFEVEDWIVSLKFRNEVQIWIWNFDFKFEFEVEVEVQSWSLNLMFSVENWSCKFESESWKLKFDMKV